MNAVDTNVLIYAHDPREAEKQAAAVSLIQSIDEPVLLWQVACEYLAASRKLEPVGYTFEEAWQDVQQLRSVWVTVLPTWETLERAQNLLNTYSLSFWDAMILAACLESDVQTLYSEDFGAYPQMDGLKTIDPFREAGHGSP